MAMQQQTDTRALVSIEHQGGLIPAQSEWKLLREMAASLVPTGFLPSGIKTPEQAVAVMLKGRELRVPPMYALSNIVVVQGKPTCGAELMLALIYRDHGKKAIRVKESTDQQCTVEYRLEGWDGVQSYSFTIEQAEQAGLFKNAVWKQYPAAMLRARCVSAVARMAFPESIGGMYSPGELGDDVAVTDEGDVVSVSGREVSQQPEEIGAPRQSRQDRPRATKAAELVSVDTESTQAPLYSESDEWQEASKKLHAVAGNIGVDHEVLHAMALLKGRQSLKEIDPQTLTKMTAFLQTDEFDGYYTKYIAPKLEQLEEDGDA